MVKPWVLESNHTQAPEGVTAREVIEHLKIRCHPGNEKRYRREKVPTRKGTAAREKVPPREKRYRAAREKVPRRARKGTADLKRGTRTLNVESVTNQLVEIRVTSGSLEPEPISESIVGIENAKELEGLVTQCCPHCGASLLPHRHQKKPS